MRIARVALCILMLTRGVARAQSVQNVLVVANEASSGSVQIANHYARKHSIPTDQVLLIRAPVEDEIDRPTYQRQIESPIAAWLRETSHLACMLPGSAAASASRVARLS